jgi:hypothetical protein
MKGWELMSVLLQIFPPSNLFFEYIDSFVFHRLRGMGRADIEMARGFVNA